MVGSTLLLSNERLNSKKVTFTFNSFKIEGSRKLTRCGFGSYAQPTQVVYGSEVPYHSCCLPYRVWFWVGPLGYSGPFSFWGSFLAIFSYFSNGPSDKNISGMTPNHTHKLKPSS